MFGTRAKRKIAHRSIKQDGMWVPMCNVHYGGKIDHGRTRTFREAEGVELDYKVCGRCGQKVAFQLKEAPSQ
jgi:hypothetical protein